MGFDFLNMEKTPMTLNIKGQLITVYGRGNVGKSYVVGHMENAIMLETEHGASALGDVYKHNINKWNDFVDFVNQMTSEEKIGESTRGKMMRDKFSTVGIDSIDYLYTLCEENTCRIYGLKNMADGVGRSDIPNSYVHARTNWSNTFNKLFSVKDEITIVGIAHEEIIKVTDNDGVEHEFIEPKGYSKEKGSYRWFYDRCDFVYYVEGNDNDIDSDEVALSTAYACKTKRFYARSRYFKCDKVVNPFTVGNLEANILGAIKATAEMSESEIVEQYAVEVKVDVDELRSDVNKLCKECSKIDKNAVLEMIDRVLGCKVKECDDAVRLENLMSELNAYLMSQTN